MTGRDAMPRHHRLPGVGEVRSGYLKLAHGSLRSVDSLNTACVPGSGGEEEGGGEGVRKVVVLVGEGGGGRQCGWVRGR